MTKQNSGQRAKENTQETQQATGPHRFTCSYQLLQLTHAHPFPSYM